MPTPLTATSSRRADGTAVLTVTGEIDISNSSEIARTLDDTAGERLLVDLTGVDYLDSAGLTVLLTHAHHIELVAAPLLDPVLTVCGLTELTTVHRPDTPPV